MSKQKWRDRGIAGMLIVGGVYLYGETRDFPMGADLFPRFMLITIIGLAGLMLFNTFRATKQPETRPEKKPVARDIVRPYLLFLCLVGYIVLTILFGFFPATVGMGLILFPVLEVTGKKIYFGILIGTILFIYVLFVRFLNVPLPTGVWFD